MSTWLTELSSEEREALAAQVDELVASVSVALTGSPDLIALGLEVAHNFGRRPEPIVIRFSSYAARLQKRDEFFSATLLSLRRFELTI